MLLEVWIALVAVVSIIVVTVQTIRSRRRNPYDYYDLAAAIRRHPVTHNIDELRIPGLTVDEADEFWHAVNDNDGYGKEVPSEFGALVDAAADGDVIEYGGYKCLVVKKIGEH